MKNKVLLVPFPFDDLSGNKVRPVVCLTDPIGAHRHVVVAFVTSRVPAALLATDLVIAPSDDGFDMTGLRTVSTLRLHRLMTVATTTFLRELGELPMQMQEQVRNKLALLFDL
jgi:mRNA interferase MazF